MITERFAPSPTGLLHLGHAYSAWCGWTAARSGGGRFLLRHEDLDTTRVRPRFYAAIEEDLRWLGLPWHGVPLRQSARDAAYRAALAQLSATGLVYACACTRRDVEEAAGAPQEDASQEGAPQEGALPSGPDGLVYPGTCRTLGLAPAAGRALRLDIGRAIAALGGPSGTARLTFDEIGAAPDGRRGRIALDPAALVGGVGDVVLARRDGCVAYHLAVVVDDAHQRVTHVTRGRDLFDATPIHRLLQALLGLPTPVYRHHDLVRDADGRRLAKRDDARAIARYRADGLSPDDVLDAARASVRSPA